MKSLSNGKIKQEYESDMFDSDKTLVTESQENKYEKKQGQYHSDDSHNAPSEASQSLLKVKKKKHSEISEKSSSDHNDSFVKTKKVTVDFLTQDIFKQPSSEDFVRLCTPEKNKKMKNEPSGNFSDENYSTKKHNPDNKYKKKQGQCHSDDFQITPSEASQSLLKVKKKKHSEISEESSSDHSDTFVKKKKKVTVDFLTQDIFKQPSSEDFVHLHTPEKSKKKKNKKPNDNFSDENYNTKKHNPDNGLNITENHTSEVPVPYLTKQNKKVKITGQSDLSQDDTIYFGTQNIFKLPSSEEMTSTPEKLLKKKKYSEMNDSHSRTSFVSEIKENPDLIMDDLANVLTRKHRKKKKSLNSTSCTQNDDTSNNTIEFGTQDIAGIPSSKKVKKKKKESGLSCSDVNSMSTINGINPEDDLSLTTDDLYGLMKKEKKIKGLDSSSLSKNCDTVDFGTQGIFGLSNSEKIFNSTPKKHRRKNRDIKINGNNISDNRTSSINEIKQETSPINEIIQENYLSSNVGDLALTEASTTKRKKKRNKEVISSGTSQNGQIWNHTDSFDNSLPYTSGSSLHHSVEMKSDDSVMCSELDESEIKPCSKHKKKKCKDIVSKNIFRENGPSQHDSENFFCQFCISSVSNGKKDSSEALNKENNRNGFGNMKWKTSVIEPTTARRKKKDLLDLLDKYLDKEDTRLDDNSPSPFNRTQDLPCHIEDPGTEKTKKRKWNISISMDENVGLSQDPILDRSMTNYASSKVFHNSDDVEDIAGVNGLLIEIFKKRKLQKSLHETVEDDEDEILNALLSTHSEIVKNNSNVEGIVNINGYNSKSDEDDGMLSSLKDITEIKKQKKCTSINTDSQSISDNETKNLSISNTRSVKRSPQSSSSSLDGGGPDSSGANGKSAKISGNFVSGDGSETSIGRSNGIGVRFSDSEDSDDGIEEDKLDILKASLKRLNIVIDFPVPKLHHICNRASKPTQQQRKEVAEKNISIKSGKFVKSEDMKIKENWKTFAKMHDFEDVPEVFFSLNKKYISVKEKQNFLYFLAQGLDERTPFGVYQRFKILMGQLKGGRFTAEEDEYIISQVKEQKGHRNYLSDIAQHLQRPMHSIEKRIHRLKNRHTRKIRWRKDNTAAFIKYLLKATGIKSDNIEKLKNRHISSIEWKQLSHKLDNVPIRILKRAWLEKIHSMLFIPETCCDLREVKLKLINMFSENNECDWRAIDWTNYASHFEGFTSLKLYGLMKTLVNHKVPAEKKNNFKKCVKILRKLEKKDLGKNFFVYKIKYENGKIIQLGSKVATRNA